VPPRHGLTAWSAPALKASKRTLDTFVALDENLEIWQLTVTNRRANESDPLILRQYRVLSVDARTTPPTSSATSRSGEVEIEDGVIYHKTEYRERRDHFAFFACSRPTAGFDTQREAFLGPYRGWDKPATVEAGQLTNSVAHGWSPIGAHQVRLVLEPGETQQVVFVLGYHENPRDRKFDPPGSQTINKSLVKPVIARYLTARPR